MERFPPNLPELCVGDTTLETTSQFCYLGKILTSNSSAHAEINSRIGKVCVAFARLRKTVIHTHPQPQTSHNGGGVPSHISECFTLCSRDHDLI